MGRLRSFLALLGALWLPARYLMVSGGWGLYLYMLHSEPALRVPLLIYAGYILSGPGQRAAGRCRWPMLM